MEHDGNESDSSWEEINEKFDQEGNVLSSPPKERSTISQNEEPKWVDDQEEEEQVNQPTETPSLAVENEEKRPPSPRVVLDDGGVSAPSETIVVDDLLAEDEPGEEEPSKQSPGIFSSLWGWKGTSSTEVSVSGEEEQNGDGYVALQQQQQHDDEEADPSNTAGEEDEIIQADQLQKSLHETITLEEEIVAPVFEEDGDEPPVQWEDETTSTTTTPNVQEQSTPTPTTTVEDQGEETKPPPAVAAAGFSGFFSPLLYGSAPSLSNKPPTPVQQHPNVVCAGCEWNEHAAAASIAQGFRHPETGWILGNRFQSMPQKDFNFCSHCEESLMFETSHGPFITHRTPPNPPPPALPPLVEVKAVKCAMATLDVTGVKRRLSPPPPPPPPPVEEPKPQAKFDCDVTLEDGSVVCAGDVVEKVWRLQNTGTKPWPVGTKVIQVGGAEMGGKGQLVPGGVFPGDKVDISVNLELPSTLRGTCTSHWRLIDANGDLFGHRFWVTLEVIPPPPPPPPPQQQLAANFLSHLTQATEEFEMNLARLIEAGFNNTERIEQVLREEGNDVEAAFERLMMEGSSNAATDEVEVMEEHRAPSPPPSPPPPPQQQQQQQQEDFTDVVSQIVDFGFYDIARINQLLREENGNGARVIDRLLAGE